MDIGGKVAAALAQLEKASYPHKRTEVETREQSTQQNRYHEKQEVSLLQQQRSQFDPRARCAVENETFELSQQLFDNAADRKNREMIREKK